MDVRCPSVAPRICRACPHAVLHAAGANLLWNDDVEGAARAFEIIVGDVDKGLTVPPSGTAAVLAALGSIYFQANFFPKAVKRFTQSLFLENDPLSPRQRAETLCNIGSAYHEMQQLEDAEKALTKALVISRTLETSLKLTAKIMHNLAHIFYRHNHYLRAHDVFSEGKIDI